MSLGSTLLGIWCLMFGSRSFLFELSVVAEFRIFCVGKFVYNNEFRMFIEVLIFLSEMLAC